MKRGSLVATMVSITILKPQIKAGYYSFFTSMCRKNYNYQQKGVMLRDKIMFMILNYYRHKLPFIQIKNLRFKLFCRCSANDKLSLFRMQLFFLDKDLHCLGLFMSQSMTTPFCYTYKRILVKFTH